MKKILNIVNLISIIIFLLYMFIGSLLFTMRKIELIFLADKYIIFTIVFITLYVIYKIINKRKIEKCDIFMLGLLVFDILSYFFANDKNTALHGFLGRNEGLIVLTTYYSIFLLGTTQEKKYQKIIFAILIILGILEIIIGTYQTLGATYIFGYNRSFNFSANFKFASGTFGNPNFYSSFILMIFLTIYSIILHYKKLILIPLLAIFGYGLMIGNTLSCFLASFIMILTTLIIHIKKYNYKKIFVCLLICFLISILIVIVVDNKTHSRLTRKLNSNITEISDILKNGISDETGNYRVFVWKEIFKYLPKYYLFGIGIDNFSNLNDGDSICYIKAQTNYCFDKAHNEYLQILITKGILSLVIYVSFIVYVLKCNKHKYLVIPIVGYLIQALFNISVINVAPIFFLILGMSINDDILRSK